MPKKMAWSGIDPGVSGCACLLTTDQIWFHDFISEEVAAEKIDEWNYYFNVKYLLEKQVDVRKKGFNVSGKLLINYGFWRGLLVSNSCNWKTLSPNQWQMIMPGKKHKGEDTKDRSLFYAKKYYPSASLKLCLKKNHNRADALLMAHYMRETEFLSL
jgi:hypothetical protein